MKRISYETAKLAAKAGYNRFIDTILQHILTNIIYETSKSSL